MMRITHINFAKGFRGGERQTLLLIQELALRGYHQKILTRQNSTLAKRLEGVENLEIIEIPKPYIFSLSTIKEASLLHAHETKGAQFAFWANLFYKIPYIVTRRVDNLIKNNFFNRWIYEQSYRTVALSRAIEKELFKISDQINIDIIPSAYSEFTINSIEVDVIKERFEDKFLIANIGELDNGHKGQYYLIEAMKKLQQEYPNIHLILLGKGKDKQAYMEQSKELESITFEGFVDNVGDYLQAVDLFVFPSLNEGLGSILFDVMHSNIAIIASNVGGIPDIIEDHHNGILVPSKDSEAIYEKIKKLYEDPKLREQLSNQAQQSVENFSPQKMSSQYENIYKGVI
ncbi:MAG: glycosyltransferase family 4 protein [Campylobacterota bacterium]|nr:glycosyltransferase family 4 protein [Campylobacterota bacterium]